MGSITRRLLPLIVALVVSLTLMPECRAAETDELSALVAQSDKYYDTGRYLDAVPVAERIVTLTREQFGEKDPRYAAALNGLATFLQFTGSLDRAAQLLRQALEIDQAALGLDHPDTITREANLALVLLDKDNAAEAADLLHRALASLDRQAAKPETYGTTLSNFAAALERLNRYADAEELYRAAIAEFRTDPAKNAARLAIALGNLGLQLKSQHRLDKARPLLQEAVSTLEGLSTPAAPHPRLATALNNFGTLLEDQGDYGKAEELYQQALALDRAMFGPDNPRLATRLSNLANLYVNQSRFDEATVALREAMRIDKAAYGEDHPRVAHILLDAARLLAAKKQWEGAYTLISRSSDIMIDADTRRGQMQGRFAAGRDVADISLSQIIYATFLQISGEWPWTDTSQFAKLGGPAFDIAQRQVRPADAAAIARMASRYAGGIPELADKVRRQQDLLEKWNIAETRIIAQLAQPADHIDSEAVTIARRGEAELERELQAVGAEIQAASPDLTTLAGTKVLTIARVQELLAADEGLVYLADDGVHIHAFFLTKEAAAWMPLAYTSATINEHVEALRCGLDATSWFDDRAAQCFKLLHVNYSEDDLQRGEPLPFDFGRAHQLYEAIFGTLGSRVAGKRLIVVPSGALATLPFQVLVTAEPDNTLKGDQRYQKAAWFSAQQPVTVLPSIASLEALRGAVPQDRASQPFLGVGNPLLDGPISAAMSAQSKRQIQSVAERAREKTACASAASVIDRPRLPQQLALDTPRPSRGAAGGAGSVNILMPLPETADELCAIAQSLGVTADDVLLGPKATKEAVLKRSRSGDLAAFAVIHFATHGLVSGELDGLTEPALALTPTQAANDDGLLTASDIAELRLNADWVVLSSCNTAAGSGDDKGPFSGLARAFFLAGARALLVSHWQVYSEAAVSLTTRAYQSLKANPALGRAEALRRSMMAIVSEGGAKARPAYWAPFVVVGDGG